MSEIESEVRILARIQVEAARREITWIAQRLAAVARDRKKLDAREAELLADRHAAQFRLREGLAGLDGKP